jgi:MATE family multidrug resistance protein
MLVWTTGWNWREAWGGVGEFLSLGIPGMLQLCFEWWTFEVLAILCGRFDNAVVAIGANAILLQICSMVYMLYLGISVSANVRIGNALGDGQPHRANLVANLSVGLSTCGSIVCAATLWIGRTQLPYLFTNDVEIAALTSKLLRVGAAFQMADACQAAINGIFRGSGRQTLGATLNFVAYYVIGLPLGTLLAFYFHYNVQGLWIGLTVSLYFISFVGMVVVSKSDWVQLSKDAKARSAHPNAPPTTTQHVPIIGSP